MVQGLGLFDEGILAVDVRMDPELGYPRWFHVAASDVGGGPFGGPFTIVVTIDLVLPFVPIDEEPGSGAQSDADERAYLQARALWEEAALEEYRYVLQLHCECPLAESGPFEITVRGGELASSVGPLAGAGPLPDTVMITELFDVIAGAIGGGVDVDVTYDETFGFPLLAMVDTAAVAVDGGMAFSISEFELIYDTRSR